MRTLISVVQFILIAIAKYFSYLVNKSFTKNSLFMAKQTTEVAVAGAKIVASIVVSARDGKISLKDDASNFTDDIFAVITAIDGIDQVVEEFPLSDVDREKVVDAAALAYATDIGLDPTDENLEAAKDVGVGLLAAITLALTAKAKPEQPNV